MDSLTWIYERHSQDLESTMENLKVVEVTLLEFTGLLSTLCCFIPFSLLFIEKSCYFQTVVAMLREAIENEHHVFAFKAVYFLLLTVEHGGRPYVGRFVKAGGIATIIPLMVMSLDRV